MRKHLSLVGTAAAIGLVALSSAAKADILPSTAGPTVTANGNGTFTWTYEVFVTGAQTVNPGNSFTFYDFQGFTGQATATNGQFTPTTTLVSPAPVITPFGAVTPNDSAGIPNITFTFSGATPIVGQGINGTSLGTFSLVSTLGGPGVRNPFLGRGTDTDSGLLNANITNYIAPVPEPGEYAVAGIFGAGLIGLMVRARRRTAREGGMASA